MFYRISHNQKQYTTVELDDFLLARLLIVLIREYIFSRGSIVPMPPSIGQLALAETSSRVRSDEASRDLCEKRYAKLNCCAQKASQGHVVALYRREYLDALLSYENPTDACALLIKCADAYERIRKLEETLDKMHFTELLRKSCMGMLRYEHFSNFWLRGFAYFYLPKQP